MRSGFKDIRISQKVIAYSGHVNLFNAYRSAENIAVIRNGLTYEKFGCGLRGGNMLFVIRRSNTAGILLSIIWNWLVVEVVGTVVVAEWQE